MTLVRRCHVWASRDPPCRVPLEISRPPPRSKTSCWRRESVSPPTLIFPTLGMPLETIQIHIVKARRKLRQRTARRSSTLTKRATKKDARVARMKWKRENVWLCRWGRTRRGTRDADRDCRGCLPAFRGSARGTASGESTGAASWKTENERRSGLPGTIVGRSRRFGEWNTFLCEQTVETDFWINDRSEI